MKLAFDRSARTISVDGHLHVAVSNITKANVCPYYGREIPGSDTLGLNPDKVYMLLRDPVELAAAASTFNNLPLLSKHVHVRAENPEHDLVVGSTGTDAAFDGTYLTNSIVVWDQLAIDGIETKEQCELSSAYHFAVDWMPGVYENIAYDGRMTNIIGNHVALVEVGRAGPDVVVGDKNPFTTTEYQTMKASRKAVAIRAALGVFLRPQLAMDAAIVDLGALVRGVKSATIAQDQARIVKDVAAKIPDVDQAALAEVLKIAADAEPDDEKEPVAKDAGEQQDGESDEDYAKRKKLAADAADDKDDGKPAMDAATVQTLLAKQHATTVAHMNALRQAERDVLPLIGEVIGQDSAANVYKLALDAASVDTTGVDPTAYGAMVKMLNVNAETAVAAPVVAMDSAAKSSFAERFPTAHNLKRG